MSYPHYQPDKPVMTDTGQQIVDVTRTNLMAMRDAVILGALPGWAESYGGVDPAHPDYMMWVHADEQLRASYTWEGDTPTVVTYDYSSDAGNTWQTIGTETLEWDSSGTLPTTTWSAL